MAKKIVSVFLAILLLVIALFMTANLASDLVMRLVSIVEFLSIGNGLHIGHFHYYYHGHALHIYGFSDCLPQNVLNNQSYFQSETLCFIATTISNWANFVKNASVALGFVSLAIVVFSCVIPKIGGKIKAIGKVLLIIAFFGIFAGNLVIGFIDTASWIRTVIWFIQGILSNFAVGEILTLALGFIRYTLWKMDNYVYALAALVGAIYVLTTMFSKKSAISKEEKKAKMLAKLEKKQEKLKKELEIQEA